MYVIDREIKSDSNVYFNNVGNHLRLLKYIFYDTIDPWRVRRQDVTCVALRRSKIWGNRIGRRHLEATPVSARESSVVHKRKQKRKNVRIA